MNENLQIIYIAILKYKLKPEIDKIGYNVYSIDFIKDPEYPAALASQFEEFVTRAGNYNLLRMQPHVILGDNRGMDKRGMKDFYNKAYEELL